MRFVSFDLETTGFLPGIDQITEIGAVRFVDGKPEAAFTSLVDPQRTIPEAAKNITGITDEMVQGKPRIDTLLAPFADFCCEDPIVAHNAQFDFQFLTADIQKYELPAPKGIVLDTCAMARKILPGLPNYKLGTLVSHLSIKSTGFHRAEQDAFYCGQLYWHMYQKISQDGQAPSIESLINLSGATALKFPQIVPQPKQLDLL